MTSRQSIVAEYFDGFRHGDHDQILRCLTEDVAWDIPGRTSLRGKEAFDGEIENAAFVGRPTLDVDRVVEDGDTAVAIGEGRGSLASGGTVRFAFCTVLTFRDELISRVESYVVPLS